MTVGGIPLQVRGHPVAQLCDGSQVPLTGAYGFRSDVESRVDRIAPRLNTPADQA
ncbi:hypothetical protein [Streptomyces sp. NPDC059371]|uniref:hypothetical protein n=1 Tax=Streptomyces sp. NPDC059371 TaxID=3346812 RepID=UPI0036BE6FEB